MKPFYRHYWPLLKEPLVIAATAVICLCLAEALRLAQVYWAVMSCIIVMQDSVQETITASLNRVAGTAVGALIGGLFLDLYGSNVWTFGIGVMIVILICLLLNLKQSYRLAAVTVGIILLVNHTDTAWLTAWHRFLEVSLGVVVALIVSIAVNPLYSYGLLQGWLNSHRRGGK